MKKISVILLQLMLFLNIFAIRYKGMSGFVRNKNQGLRYMFEDNNFKVGIIVLIVVLVLLIIIKIYNNHQKNKKK